MKNPRRLLLASALFASALPGSAATLVSYLDNAYGAGDLTNGNDSLAYSVAASNVTASALTKWTTSDTNNGYSTTTGTFYTRSDLVPSTTATAPWLTFSVGAQDGHALSLTSLTFIFGGSYSQTTSSASYTANVAVYYSFDNFATEGTLVSSTNNSAITLPAAPAMNLGYSVNMDLTSLAGLSSSQPVTFRLLFTDNSTSSNISLRVDDIALNGSVSAIPEPSTYAIVASVAVLGLAGARRRLHRHAAL